jgi:HEAT repeat protein
MKRFFFGLVVLSILFMEACSPQAAPVIETKIAALKNDDPSARWQAAMALGDAKDKRAIEPLVAALSDKDSGVRMEATWALVKFSASAVEPLITALNGDDPNGRMNAAEALGEIGDVRAVGPLLNALKDNDETVRYSMNSALMHIDMDASVIDLLLAAMKKDENSMERSIALSKLVILGEPAVAPLIALLNDKVQTVQKDAAQELVRIGKPAVEPLIAELKNENIVLRKEAAQILGEIRDSRAVEPLISLLKDSEADTRASAAKALGEIKDTRAVEPLIIALSDADPSVRDEAAWALGELKDPRAIESLILALNGEDAKVMFGAANALKTIGEPAIEPVIRYLKNEKSRNRGMGGFILQEMGFPALDALISLLQDPDPLVRETSAQAIGNMYVGVEKKDARAVEPLRKCLKDENERVRYAAASALGRIGAPAIETLIEALQDSDKETRDAAAYALREERDSRLVEPLIAAMNEKDITIRSNIVYALGNQEDVRAVEPLISALQDKDYFIRRTAGDALGKLKDERAILPLINVLNDKDNNNNDQDYASLALEKIGVPAVEPLITALGNNNAGIRRKAANVLLTIGDKRYFEPFLAALKNRNVEIVSGAYAFFIQQGIKDTEGILITALEKYGTKEMAEDFLNCGNKLLEDAGTQWAKVNHYRITKLNFGTNVPGPIWGRIR